MAAGSQGKVSRDDMVAFLAGLGDFVRKIEVEVRDLEGDYEVRSAKRRTLEEAEFGAPFADEIHEKLASYLKQIRAMKDAVSSRKTQLEGRFKAIRNKHGEIQANVDDIKAEAAAYGCIFAEDDPTFLVPDLDADDDHDEDEESHDHGSVVSEPEQSLLPKTTTTIPSVLEIGLSKPTLLNLGFKFKEDQNSQVNISSAWNETSEAKGLYVAGGDENRGKGVRSTPVQSCAAREKSRQRRSSFTEFSDTSNITTTPRTPLMSILKATAKSTSPTSGTAEKRYQEVPPSSSDAAIPSWAKGIGLSKAALSKFKESEQVKDFNCHSQPSETVKDGLRAADSDNEEISSMLKSLSHASLEMSRVEITPGLMVKRPSARRQVPLVDADNLRRPGASGARSGSREEAAAFSYGLLEPPMLKTVDISKYFGNYNQKISLDEAGENENPNMKSK